ncbi:MAG: hypothetical protein H7250_09975 [Flavobacterium sp.]|nr:hypothetical protein [Flavobacterium sp.]
MFYKITRSDDSAIKTIHQTHRTVTSSDFAQGNGPKLYREVLKTNL